MSAVGHDNISMNAPTAFAPIPNLSYYISGVEHVQGANGSMNNIAAASTALSSIVNNISSGALNTNRMDAAYSKYLSGLNGEQIEGFRQISDQFAQHIDSIKQMIQDPDSFNGSLGTLPDLIQSLTNAHSSGSFPPLQEYQNIMEELKDTTQEKPAGNESGFRTNPNRDFGGEFVDFANNTIDATKSIYNTGKDVMGKIVEGLTVIKTAAPLLGTVGASAGTLATTALGGIEVAAASLSSTLGSIATTAVAAITSSPVAMAAIGVAMVGLSIYSIYSAVTGQNNAVLDTFASWSHSLFGSLF